MNVIRTARYAINPDQISFIDFGKPGTEDVIVAVGPHALTLTGDEAKMVRDDYPLPEVRAKAPVPEPTAVQIDEVKAKALAMTAEHPAPVPLA